MVTVPLLVLAALSVWLWWRRSRRPLTPLERALRDLPTGLPTLPVIGHLHHFLNRTDVQTKYAEILRRIASYGHDTYCMWVGRKPWVFINHPEDIQAVLNNSKSMEKTGEYKLLRFAAGDGLFTCDVARWKLTRGPMQALVHPRNLDHLVPGLNQRSQGLARRLSVKVGAGPTDLFDLMYHFALQNVMSLTFGPDVVLDMDSKEFHHIKDATVLGFKLFAERLFTRWLQWESVFRFLHRKSIQAIRDSWELAPDEVKKTVKQFDNAADLLNNNNGDQISDRKLDPDVKPVILSDIYVAMKRQHPQITRENYLEEAHTLIAGGSDTVATAICSCLLALAAHPDIQDRLYEEIVDVVGKEPSVISQDDVRNMPYLNCVLKETMRRFSVVPQIMRRNEEEMKLRECTIPANTKIVINILGQNMSSKLYPDPERFDPDRFNPENVSQRDRYAYVPFCAGPRDCLGKPYAILFIKIVVATLVQQYKLTTPDDINKLTFRYEIALVSKTGYNIEFHNRLCHTTV